ncbi:MAG: flagellar hook-basal body complex protein FliE [Deltaproteobacteria bacterium]|nr:flagellar hook-basal body complex protein FliE [Deltaproteobacteria bacterium]TLN04838.1 MAG: flagellar hook-basal body complex protein FliE [bacterium]
MIIKGIGSNLGVTGLSNPIPAAGAKTTGTSSVTEGFTQIFGDAISKVNDLQKQSDVAIGKLATGESKGLHEVMIAMEKSSISFQFLTQVRNKALDAYHEIMRMQV